MNANDIKNNGEIQFQFANLDFSKNLKNKISNINDLSKRRHLFQEYTFKIEEKEFQSKNFFENNDIHDYIQLNNLNMKKQRQTTEKIKEVNEEKMKIMEKIHQIEYIMNENLICPINHGLFSDPVLAEDGQTYEKDSINEWFKDRKSVV